MQSIWQRTQNAHYDDVLSNLAKLLRNTIKLFDNFHVKFNIHMAYFNKTQDCLYYSHMRLWSMGHIEHQGILNLYL